MGKPLLPPEVHLLGHKGNLSQAHLAVASSAAAAAAAAAAPMLRAVAAAAANQFVSLRRLASSWLPTADCRLPTCCLTAALPQLLLLLLLL